MYKRQLITFRADYVSVVSERNQINSVLVRQDGVFVRSAASAFVELDIRTCRLNVKRDGIVYRFRIVPNRKVAAGDGEFALRFFLLAVFYAVGVVSVGE